MRILQNNINSMDDELDVLKEGLNPDNNSVKDMQDILDKSTRAFSYETWEAIMDRLFSQQKEQQQNQLEPADKTTPISNSNPDADPSQNHKIIHYDDFESSEIDWQYDDLNLKDI